MKNKNYQAGELSAKEVELINACGPFNHSRWEGRGVSVSQEEGLTGRGDLLVKQIHSIITGHFKTSEIKHMSIADIGCYDGWLLDQLGDLPFKKLVGVEPRGKNIAKGKKIRKLLGIRSNVVFRKSDIFALGRERFDVVICAGLLHHLESAPTALRQLDRITEKLLIINTIVLPSRYITDAFKKDMELKDVIYRTKKLCGVTGQKYESAYYDGSTIETAVVSLPSVESLLMYLDILGYKLVKVVVGPRAFRKALPQNQRQFDEVILYAIKPDGGSKQPDPVAQGIREYERGLIEKSLDQKLVRSLYERHKKNRPVRLSNTATIISRYIKTGSPSSWRSLVRLFPDRFRLEIVKNLKYNTADKISLEWGKLLYSKKDYQGAIEVLQSITQKINADWRAVYRAFYLLSLIYKKEGDDDKSLYYKKLCDTCNVSFPLTGDSSRG